MWAWCSSRSTVAVASVLARAKLKAYNDEAHA
jgi:hypothetical protein